MRQEKYSYRAKMIVRKCIPPYQMVTLSLVLWHFFIIDMGT